MSERATTTTTISIPVRVGFEYDDGAVTDLSRADLSGRATDDAFSAKLSASLTESVTAKMFGVLGVKAGLGPSSTWRTSRTLDSPA